MYGFWPRYFWQLSIYSETTVALFDAIYNRCQATAFIDKITALYNTEAPAEAVAPYATFSLPSNIPDGEFGVDWEDYLIQFVLYSQEPLATEVCAAYTALKAAYDHHDLVVADYEPIIMERESAVLIRVEQMAWEYAVTYRLLIEKT